MTLPPVSPFQPMQPPGRAIDDPAVVRKAIFDRALQTVSELPPVSNQMHTLRFENPHYAGPDNVPLRVQKQALLGGRSVGRPLRATAVLQDNATGNELGRRKILLASIPYYTNRATFINNGTEYALSHQLRLKPGGYTREKENGELETHVNILPGQGVPHRLFMDPETGIFRIRIQQAQIPAVPLLRALGVTDQQLREAWGDNLAKVNISKTNAGDLGKLYKRIVPKGTAADPPGMEAGIREAVLKTKIDPWVSQQTLGKPFDHIDGDAVLTATRKLLAVRNRKDPEFLKTLGLEPGEQDDRDNLAFMRLFGPEDVIAERLKSAAAQLKQQLWRVGRLRPGQTSLQDLKGLQTGVLDSGVREAILQSGLGQVSEMINPAQVYDQQMRVTRMGIGGIPSIDAIPESSQSVQPSHLGFIDPILTPESEKAGIDVRLSRNIRKGDNGEIYAKFRDPKTGQDVWKQPEDVFDSVIAFPGQGEVDWNSTKKISALHRGKIVRLPANKAQFTLGDPEQAFSPASNMVAVKSGMKGQRVAMAARMLTQSLPLLQGQAPFVRTADIDDPTRSFETVYGERMGAVRAKQGGTVLSASQDELVVQYADGTKDTIELAQNLPGNRKTGLHQTPLVKPGQTFNPGSLLVRSNYTDDQGDTALGLNVRTAWIPFKGYNFEDAVVVSRGLANRATSDHLYKHGVDEPTSKSRFLGMFADKFSRPQLERLDNDGIIKIGSRVEYGDPLVLSASQRQGRIGEVSRAGASSWTDRSEIWDHHSPGEVTDVVRRKDGGVAVVVKTARTLQVGDKLSGRHGNKGVISYIAPDEEMPTDEQGRPFELLYNPHGTISRSNPSQAVEGWLGKVAEKTGKPYILKDFKTEDELVALAERELAAHGLKDAETLTDPETGQAIPDILTGNTFVMKLHHVSEDKISGRAFGAYSADNTPARGGSEGAKMWGVLHLNALLSHGATGAIRDKQLVRGQANPEYWSAVQRGLNPPDPPVPALYETFVNQLRAAGMNPVRTGTRTQLMAMTPQVIRQLAEHRVIKNSSTVDWDDANLKPVPGGLFDESLFGGAAGNKWARLPLSEPMLNPLMQDPARRLLGLTNQGLLDVISGKEKLGDHTGPEAVYRALNAIDVEQEIKRAETELKTGRKMKRDAAIRRLGPLLGARNTGVHPRDWMWMDAPIMPPKLRPVSKMKGTETPIVADINYLYKDLFEANKNLQEMRGRSDDVGDERLALYNTLKAVAGFGDPVSPTYREQGVKGILKYITGSSPKYGIVQRKLLGNTTDLVGRATIIPNPDLAMDEVGLPEDKAWKVYEPFITRHLVQRGMNPYRAAVAVSEREGSARDALLAVMQERPVYIDRAPVLHRYGVMAFWPRLTKSTNLETSPIVIKGFGGDYDGDAMQFHVPGTDDAVRDAVEKMMPSKNLFAVRNFGPQWAPTQEYLGGLYAASTSKGSDKPVTFATKSDAIRAIRTGKLPFNQPLEIIDETR